MNACIAVFQSIDVEFAGAQVDLVLFQIDSLANSWSVPVHGHNEQPVAIAMPADILGGFA